jgi:voltage-gated sodium channel
MVASIQSLREQLGAWIDHPRQQTFIIAVILINAVTLGLETMPQMQRMMGGALHAIDQLILAIFVVEIALKLIGRGWRFFLNGWNLFDFVIVGIALVPAASALSVLRTLRVFRLLRLVNKVPRLRNIVESMLRSIPSIGWVSAMLLLIFYIFAVIGTNLFGAAFPEWFGGLGASLYTLFQVMTLESWSMGIARPVIEQFPYAALFFVPFILVATYSMLNLFIAIIVSTMQALHDEEKQAREPEIHLNEELIQEMRLLRERITTLEDGLRAAEARHLGMPIEEFLSVPESEATS